MIGGLYGVADAAFGDPAWQVRVLADEGVSPVQLRCKGWPVEAVRHLALGLRGVATGLVLNDHAALAAELGLYAHLGDQDGAALGPHGRSTHTLAQVRAAHGAAYIGFGPVFATGTKDSPWPPRGLPLLAAAVRASPCPVVAIGGITGDNIDEVRATGAAGWAVISGIWLAPDPLAAIRRLR